MDQNTLLADHGLLNLEAVPYVTVDMPNGFMEFCSVFFCFFVSFVSLRLCAFFFYKLIV